MRFRKKPVVVTAEQWMPGIKIEGVITDPHKVRFSTPAVGGESGIADCLETGVHGHPNVGAIRTMEGWHLVLPGDWIITGVEGELYPCKPDIFAKTYEAVSENSAEAIAVNSAPTPNHHQAAKEFLRSIKDQCIQLFGTYIGLSEDELAGFLAQREATLRAELAAEKQRAGDLMRAIVDIRDKWVPALLRDAREADKTDCNAHSVFSVCVRVAPQFAAATPEGEKQ